MARVAIRTLGCKVNRTESEALAESLLGAGASVVDDADDADLVVVNTCTVTGEADAKARKEVRRALAACPGPVVVTGCLASLDADGLRALGERVVVEPNRAALADRVSQALGTRTAQRADETRRTLLRAERGGTPFRTRVMVKVQDGCDHRCAYCIVPDARGVPRSVPAQDVLDRVRALAAAGAPEVVLTGINIGRYADPGSGIGDLARLIDEVVATGISRIRISSIEPLDLTDRFADALRRSGGAVVPHLHVPLQSGCDRTLADMRRGYTADEFADALARVRSAVPGLAATTDVIVGFPGETDADFAESLAFVERCGFARLHVFRYSRRAGTPAGGRADQIPPQLVARRAAAMRSLSQELERTFAASRVGSVADVLVERVRGSEAVGTTEHGLHVSLRMPDVRTGQVVRARLRVSGDGLTAEPGPPE